MIGWHHQLNGHEFDQAPGDSEGQKSLECCSPWGGKESDMIEQLNNNKYVPGTILGANDLIKATRVQVLWGLIV